MKRSFALLACLLVLGSSVFAATGKDVTYKSGNDTVHGVLYEPAGKGPHPALVVIHEWWGLVPWVKEQASKLADQGYVALAVDLYRGKTASSPDEAHELMRGVPPDRATRDLLAAVNYLRSLKNVDPSKVGDIGWCMGGGYAFELAVNDPKLKAAVINYGATSDDPNILKRINAAVLGIFGGQDRGISPEDSKKFGEQMDKLGKTAQIRVFADAGHAFENPNNKQGYRPQDAQEASQLTSSFLEQHLKK
jgi:carboxymethylenebutenolidase